MLLRMGELLHIVSGFFLVHHAHLACGGFDLALFFGCLAIEMFVLLSCAMHRVVLMLARAKRGFAYVSVYMS